MIYAALLLSACLAASGQVLLKLGADGRTIGAALLNGYVVAGLTCYGLGLILWLIALTRLPLTIVYPFTLVTLGLVFGASLVMLGEKPTPLVLVGWLIVVIGVSIVGLGSFSSRP